MKLGFLKPSFPNEKRVAVLPEDLTDNEICNQIFIEAGFGEFLNIQMRKNIAAQVVKFFPERRSLNAAMRFFP